MAIIDADQSNEFGYRFKVILGGDGGVGKTSLIHKFVTGSFKADYKATIGVAITSKRLAVNKSEVSLQIWDIAGQTLFKTFRSKFYSNARGALLVYDITVPKTLDNLHQWISDIEGICGKIPYILIGNKSDLTELRAITADEVVEFQKAEKIDTHYNTSALTGDNVEEAFSKIATLMI